MTGLGSEYISFADGEARVQEFHALLERLGHPVQAKSELAKGCELLQELHDRHRNGSTRPWSTLRDDLQLAVGTLQLIELILRRKDHPEFSRCIPHIGMLSDGAVAQNVPSDRNDEVSNKVLELIVALGLLGRAGELTLDDPKHSSGGKNPDILCTFEGKMFGVACKAIHGDAPMSLFNNLAKGVDQIEKSAANTGIVVFNFKNRIPQQDLFPNLTPGGDDPVLGTYQDVRAPMWRASRWVLDRFNKMVEHVTPEEVWKELRSKRALPGALAFVDLGVGVMTPKGPAPTICGFLQLIPLQFSPLALPDPFEGYPMRCLRQLNDGLQLALPMSPIGL